jgi:hypothetical protein
MDWMIPLQFVLLLLPWAWGVAFMGWCLAPAADCRNGVAMIVIGAGAYLGYMVMAGVLYLANGLHLPAFSCYIVFALVTGLSLAIAASKTWADKAHTKPAQPAMRRQKYLEGAVTTVLLLLTIAAAGFATLENFLRPAETWDALQHWSLEATSFLKHHTSEEGIDGAYQFTKSSHWPTIKLVAAWSGWTATFTENQYFVYAPWVLLLYGLGIAAAGLALLLTGSGFLAALAAYLLTASPMVTVHTSLGGYADLWQAAGAFLFMALVLSVPFSKRRVPLIGCTLLFTAAVAFTKGNGVVYAVILLSALALAYMLAQVRWHLSLPILAVLLGLVTLLASQGFDLNLGGYRIALLPTEDLVALGKRTSGIPASNWPGVLENSLEAWLRSASFNGAMFTITLATIVILGSRPSRLTFGHFFSVGVPFGVALFLALAQRYSLYFFEFATPARDTGFSRFSTTLYVCMIPALFFAIGSLPSHDSSAARS